MATSVKRLVLLASVALYLPHIVSPFPHGDSKRLISRQEEESETAIGWTLSSPGITVTDDTAPTDDTEATDDTAVADDAVPSDDNAVTDDTAATDDNAATDAAPTDDTETTDNTETTEDTETTNDTETTDNTEATDDTAVADDAAPSDDTETTEDTAPTDDTAPTEDAETTDDTETTDNTEATDDTAVADDAAPSDDTETTEDTAPTDDTAPTEDAETTDDTETTDDVEATNDTEATDDAEATDDTTPFKSMVEGTKPWDTVECNDPGVTDHTENPAERWKKVDGAGAWQAVLDGWGQNITNGRPEINFANNVSNYFHAPQDMYCETFSNGGTGCLDKNLQCQSTTHPAGYFILHSFENLFAMHSNLYAATEEAVGKNDIGPISKDFGKIPEKAGGLDGKIAVDIALFAWGLIMGAAWNKALVPGIGANWGSTVKDTTNDIVKNSMAVVKDTMKARAEDKLGVQNGLQAQMQAITAGWQDSIQSTNEWLFGGSEEGNQQLGDMIADGAMFGDGFLINRKEHAERVKKIMNAFLIPLAWRYSPDGIRPWIAASGVGCEETPNWKNEYHDYITSDSLANGRFCYEGQSYWLLMGRDAGKQCREIGRETSTTICELFESPPGLKELKDGTYSKITLENLIAGSLNTKAANNGLNGEFKPIEGREKAMLESYLEKDIEAAGIWNIPVCSMEEAIENYVDWYEGEEFDMSIFPCGAGEPVDEDIELKKISSIISPLHGPVVFRGGMQAPEEDGESE